MAESILSVDTDYVVRYHGQVLGLATPVKVEMVETLWGSFNPYTFQLPRHRISFECREFLPPEPKPKKPKRSVARSLGLRRPR